MQYNILCRIVRHISITIPWMHITHILCTTPGIPCRQYSLECRTKLRIENGINDRIEGGIRIAEPTQYLKRLTGNASFTECGHNVDAKERHPAY